MSGKPFGENFNVSALKFHASATVIYSAHFVKVSAFLLRLFYFIFWILVKRLLQSRDGALQERISINLEKKICWKAFLFIFVWFFLISLPSSSARQRGWSTETHIYKTEKYAATNFAVAYKTSLTQLHCVLPLFLGSRSDKIWIFQLRNFTHVLRWSMHPTLKTCRARSSQRRVSALAASTSPPRDPERR